MRELCNLVLGPLRLDSTPGGRRGDTVIDNASELWIGQFNIVAGHVQEQGPWVSSSQLQAGGEPVRLYVVTEPATPESQQYTEQLGEAIGTLFSRQDYSLTGNLTRALRAAHEHLKDWNRTSMPNEQVGAGVSILALREDVGYLGQVGPSLAFYGDGTRVRRLRPAQPAPEEGIGLATDFRVSLQRFELGLGESVLLAGSALGLTLQDEHATALLGMDPEEALGQVYVVLKEQQNLGAILISHVPAGALHGPTTSADSFEQSPGPAYASEVIDDTAYEMPGAEAPPRRTEAPPSRDPFAR